MKPENGNWEGGHTAAGVTVAVYTFLITLYCFKHKPSCRSPSVVSCPAAPEGRAACLAPRTPPSSLAPDDHPSPGACMHVWEGEGERPIVLSQSADGAATNANI